MIDSIKQKLEKLNNPKPTSFKKAGVLIGILYFDEFIKDPHIVFTKRSTKVSTHSGEVSFPGGKWEEGDEDLYQTSLRESFCLLYTSPSPRDVEESRMPSSA